MLTIGDVVILSKAVGDLSDFKNRVGEVVSFQDGNADVCLRRHGPDPSLAVEVAVDSLQKVPKMWFEPSCLDDVGWMPLHLEDFAFGSNLMDVICKGCSPHSLPTSSHFVKMDFVIWCTYWELLRIVEDFRRGHDGEVAYKDQLDTGCTRATTFTKDSRFMCLHNYRVCGHVTSLKALFDHKGVIISLAQDFKTEQE